MKIWDLEEQNAEDALFFDHIGHVNKITDVQWSKESPWSILSVSDDMDPARAGCSLQVFRPLDLLTMPQEEAQKKLQGLLEKEESPTKVSNDEL